VKLGAFNPESGKDFPHLGNDMENPKIGRRALIF